MQAERKGITLQTPLSLQKTSSGKNKQLFRIVSRLYCEILTLKVERDCFAECCKD